MSMEDFEEDREVLMLDALYSVILITVILWYFDLYILTIIYLATICSMLLGTEEEEDIADFKYASWGEEEKEEYIINEIWNFDDPEQSNSNTERILTEMLGYDLMAYDLINLMEVRAIPPQKNKNWTEISSSMKEIQKKKEVDFVLRLIIKRGLKNVNVDDIFKIVDVSNVTSELDDNLPMNTYHLVGKRKLLENALEIAKSNDPSFWKYGNVKAVRKIMAYRYHADQLRDAWIRSGLYTASDLDYNIFKNQLLQQFNFIRNYDNWWVGDMEGLILRDDLSHAELDIYLKYRIHVIQSTYFKKQALGRAGVAKDLVTGLYFPREIYDIDITRWWDFESELFQNQDITDLFVFKHLHRSYYRSIMYPLKRKIENLL